MTKLRGKLFFLSDPTVSRSAFVTVGLSTFRGNVWGACLCFVLFAASVGSLQFLLSPQMIHGIPFVMVVFGGGGTLPPPPLSPFWSSLSLGGVNEMLRKKHDMNDRNGPKNLRDQKKKKMAEFGKQQI